MKKYQESIFLWPPNERERLYQSSNSKDMLEFCEAAYNELESDIKTGSIGAVVRFGHDQFTQAPTTEVLGNIEDWYQFYESMLYHEGEDLTTPLADDTVDEIIKSLQKYVNSDFAEPKPGKEPSYGDGQAFIDYIFGTVDDLDYDEDLDDLLYYDDTEYY